MTAHLAFYVGHGRYDDRIVRSITRSAFSHVELLAPFEGHRPRAARAISSSGRDGGVRIKTIDFHPARWTIIPLEPWHASAPWLRAKQALGAPYDWAAIAFTFALPLRWQRKEAWFCSELVAAALGLRRPHLISPGDLHDRVLELNAAYRRGRDRNAPP